MSDATVGEHRSLIGGELYAPDRTFPNVNPATGEVIGHVADCDSADACRAVAAARTAFDDGPWAHDPEFRRRCLLQLQEALRAEQERLRELIVAESGSPVLLTRGVQLETPIEDLGYWARMAADYPYETALPDLAAFGTHNRRLVRREAAGVVAAITPWNFPFYLNLSKVSPALAAGCTVVLKPAPDTPWSATELGRIVAEHTDIPAGVLNVVASSDHRVGTALTTSPDVDMVTFTGSTATGRRIMADAAATVKRLCLELGGKSAAVVLDDLPESADLERVVKACAKAVPIHAGQSCALATRLLVPRASYGRCVEIAAAATASIPPGDPTHPKTRHGPVISAAQQKRVLAHIDAARATCRLVTGGGIPDSPTGGFYVEPTLFADVDPDDPIAQEEVFGPVLAVIPHDGDDHAVRIANNSAYGLGGTVWSGDTERALAVARRIRTGTVAVNGALWLGPDTPVGGYRQSGLGREHGIAGFEEFLETKSMGFPA
ncbi:MAG TPA: aldehyde dehydrogenase family protein [Pseudonocardia sp.]|nr:aldehyde dehydrogenase family protein [Pseudonocardia sp.]